jgi:hypothetical protein
MDIAIEPRIGLLKRKLGHDNPRLGPAALEVLATRRLEAMQISRQRLGKDEHRPGRKPVFW